MKGGDLSEKFVSGEVVFRGGFLRLHRDLVALPDGSKAVREYVRHPGAVAIVALTEEGGVVLERQHRYPLGRDFVEIPAGKLEPDEAHLDTAKRELLEETGYAAAGWTRLGLVHNAIGYSDEGIELWLATGLEKREAKLDEGEFLEVTTATPAELLQWCREGQVTDAKTLTGMLWLQNVLAGAWVLDWRAAP